MARDFKTSVIFPTTTGTAAGVLGCTTSAAQVFRSGLNTLNITRASGNSGSTAALTFQTGDYFFVDEQNADQTMINNLSDGTKGEAIYSSTAPFGGQLSTAPSSVNTTTGLWTYAAAHGLVDNQVIVFTSITGGGGTFKTFTPYVVIYVSTTTFYLSTRWSKIPIVPGANVTASTLYYTNSLYGLGLNSLPGQAGANPEPLPSQYVRPLYVRVVVQPNCATSANSAAVNITDLTLTVTGSYVRGVIASPTGASTDYDMTPYTTVAQRTFRQTFFDGYANGVAAAQGNFGAIFSMPLQTDFPFLRFGLSFGRTESGNGTSATGQFTTSSLLNVGLQLVTGRENALA